MKKLLIAASAMALTAGAAQAEVNVAFFLDWATPNQIAKVQGDYEDAMGVEVNWTNFSSGNEMSEAMLAGDIDISFSQGLAPFVNAVASGAPLKMVGIAVEYSPNPCIVSDALGIDNTNASELEGKTVAVPIGTMADYSFIKQMDLLGVDRSTMTVVDQLPDDGAASLTDGSVDMVCLFGADAEATALEVGSYVMTADELRDNNITSIDIISVTESFAAESPELVTAFLAVTSEANDNFTGSAEQMAIISADAGHSSVEITEAQMAGFSFPTVAQQIEFYFEGGSAVAASSAVNAAFRDLGDEKIASAIDGSFLE